MHRFPWLLLALAACQSEPTLAGGDTTPTAGHVFLVRTSLSAASSGAGILHMTVDDEFNAVRVAPHAVTPVASPDGRYLAWLETTFPADFTAPSVTRLRTYDRWTGDTHRVLTDADRPGSLSWSRRPLRLGFTRTGTYGGGAPAYLTAAPDGSDVRVEVEAGSLEGESPALSPDAASLLVVGSAVITGFGSASRLAEIELVSGTRRFVTAAPDSADREWVRYPAWSPDGDRVAVVSHDLVTGAVRVRVLDRQGAVRHELALGRDASWPSWSPDGTRLVFCRHVPDPARGQYSTRMELVIWTPATGGERVITPDGVADCNPSWTR